MDIIYLFIYLQELEVMIEVDLLILLSFEKQQYCWSLQ